MLKSIEEIEHEKLNDALVSWVVLNGIIDNLKFAGMNNMEICKTLNGDKRSDSLGYFELEYKGVYFLVFFDDEEIIHLCDNMDMTINGKDFNFDINYNIEEKKFEYYLYGDM